MKKIIMILLLLVIATACTDKKKDKKMMPVEADGGIGDGAEHPDSIKKYQGPPIINQDTIQDPEDQIQ